MAMEQLARHSGNFHHGFSNVKESRSEKQTAYHGKQHMGGAHEKFGGHTQNVKGGHYDAQRTHGVARTYDEQRSHGASRTYDEQRSYDRFGKDAYTKTMHHEHKDYYSTYSAKGTVIMGSTGKVVSGYALAAKDAKHKVGAAFEQFAKNPSDENRSKLEEAMRNNHKASEAFNQVKPFARYQHGHPQLYTITVFKLPVQGPSHQTPVHHHSDKPKSSLSPFEVTDAARDVLRNVYSSKRDNEPGIKELRAEAYKLFVNALSEQFKATGVIAHTNNTPSTPYHPHHHHNSHKSPYPTFNLTQFAKQKDDTFRSWQNMIGQGKNSNFFGMSKARSSAMDAHLNALSNWLNAGGKSPNGGIFVISIQKIQPIKILKPIHLGQSIGHLKPINFHKDFARQAHVTNNHKFGGWSPKTGHQGHGNHQFNAPSFHGGGKLHIASFHSNFHGGGKLRIVNSHNGGGNHFNVSGGHKAQSHHSGSAQHHNAASVSHSHKSAPAKGGGHQASGHQSHGHHKAK